MDLKSLLQSHLKKKDISIKPDEEQKKKRNSESEKLFEEYYKKWKGLDPGAVPGYQVLPKFYHKMPTEENQLKLKLREESRAAFLQRMSRELMDDDELWDLWILLKKHQSPPIGEEMINYEDFLKVIDLAGPKCKQYFKPSTFCKLLSNDHYGRISIMNFFNYAMRKVCLHQTRIELSLYDISGQGYLKETDLEGYISDLLMTLPQLKDLKKAFHPYYVCTAVRKFFFFLDPLHTCQIKIQDILACSFLNDLLELRNENLPKDQQKSNWFSAISALRVYGMYLNLDKDCNGMLSKAELLKYGIGTLTPVFVDRVFQECLTYEGEMVYKTYLDFVLALENQKEPQSLHYFFKILDIDGKGYLTSFTLNYFFRSIQEQMRQRSEDVVSFEDINDEIFDMVKPADPTKISLQELIKCGQGGIVVGMLIDLNGFWSYENREALVAENLDDAIQL